MIIIKDKAENEAPLKYHVPFTSIQPGKCMFIKKSERDKFDNQFDEKHVKRKACTLPLNVQKKGVKTMISVIKAASVLFLRP